MILCDATIRQEIEDGSIGVEPLPEDVQYQPASLDLRIGKQTYNPAMDKYQQGVKLRPDQFKLGHTIEKVTLPNDIAALVTGRSSIGRQGLLIHTVAGWIDPGFSGEITLELKNVGQETLTYDEGTRIGQMIFFRLDKSSEGYDGQYQHQRGPTR